LDDTEGLVDVLAEPQPRVEAMAADAFLVEHERDAAAAEAAADAPRLADGAARIGEQRERQPMVRLEAGVRGGVVARDADHIGAGTREVLVLIAEAARFLRAAVGLVLRIEVDDQGL